MRRSARVDVARIQNAARNAMEWFEVVGARYADTLEPEQFMYSLLTRSQRISHENLRLRDKAWLEGYERWFAARAGVPVGLERPRRRRRCSRRSACAGSRCPNRIIVLADGDVFGARRRAERFPPRASRRARARRRGPDLRRDDLRVAGCAHHARLPAACGATSRRGRGSASSISSTRNSAAKIGIQLGHAGRKGSTRVAWEGMDEPLPRPAIGR